MAKNGSSVTTITLTITEIVMVILYCKTKQCGARSKKRVRYLPSCS